MTNNIPIKLPEFWESAAAAWFAQAESQFAVRGITDDDTCYHHVVASLSSSTASRAVGFITNPPPTRRYAALKAHLLRLFELSLPERARRLLDISGLGDRRPSEHMEMMLNLLGDQEPNFLFRELFLRHMPPHVQTALAGSTATDPRALAEEADRYFLATHRQASELLAPVRAFSTPRNTQRQQRSTGRSDETASQDAAALRALSRKRETRRLTLRSSRECERAEPAAVYQGLSLETKVPVRHWCSTERHPSDDGRGGG